MVIPTFLPSLIHSCLTPFFSWQQLREVISPGTGNACTKHQKTSRWVDPRNTKLPWWTMPTTTTTTITGHTGRIKKITEKQSTLRGVVLLQSGWELKGKFLSKKGFDFQVWNLLSGSSIFWTQKVRRSLWAVAVCRAKPNLKKKPKVLIFYVKRVVMMSWLSDLGERIRFPLKGLSILLQGFGPKHISGQIMIFHQPRFPCSTATNLRAWVKHLDFPEIRRFPLLNHQLEWGRVRSL